MAIKILLADDSMTAQNMGKKILSDAGYEVVAVSNGAQAVKKVASEKPDITVLDVFMPGYSGIEVCERIKKAQETAHIPVLLTVGKMEPFRPEEGTKAGADGLIVKPFEASDLLAAVKKIEEKMASPAAEPDHEATQKIPVVEEFQDSSYEEWKVSAPAEEEEAPAAQKIEVPLEMSAAPAFGMDFEEPAAPVEPVQRSTAAIEPPVAARSTAAIEPPHMLQDTAAIEPPASVVEQARTTAEMPAPLQAATGAAAVHAPEEPPASANLPPDLAAAAASMKGTPEIEFNAAPQNFDIEHAPAPGFEPTVSQESHEVHTGRDPALVTDTDEMSKFTTKFGVEGAEPITVGVAAEMPELYADSQAPAAAPAAEASTDADFEARVAAAMAGYEEPVTQEIPAPLVPEPTPAAAPAPVAYVPEPPAPTVAEPVPVAPAPEPVAAVAEPADAGQDTAAFLAQMQEAVQNLPVDTTPHAEAAAEPVAVAPPPPAEPVAENVPDHALAAAMAAAVGGTPEPQVTAPIQATAQAAATAVARGVDPQLIADVVHRVVERMKPDLAAEIARELEAILKK